MKRFTGNATRSLVGVLTMLLMAGTVLVAPAAQAAPSCEAASCKGKNPQSEGCGSDARTVAEITYSSLRIEIRHSPACHAAWARGTNLSSSTVIGKKVAIIGYGCSEAVQSCYKGRYISAEVIELNESAFTRMWPFTDWVKACKMYDDFDGPPTRGYGACTPAR